MNTSTAKNVPDPSFSGTTCCTVLLNGTNIISANAGDSRAIIVKTNGAARALTVDHKPELEEETKRILANRGRIAAFKD